MTRKKADGVYLYGAVALKRLWCPACGGNAIVLGGKFACCEQPADTRRKYYRETPQLQTRTLPPVKVRNWLLHIQGNCCAYCGQRFGGFIENLKAMKLEQVTLHWDHAVPFSFLLANPHANWLAACSRCNGLKGNKMFDSLAEARAYIRGRRAERELESVDPPDIEDVFERQGTSEEATS